MGSDQTIAIAGHQIELSNLDKVFFPAHAITKGDLVDYYERIADTQLYHLQERPLTLERYPDGIDGEGFFQKDTPDYFPDWIRRTTLSKKDGSVKYVVADSKATLVYLANQGCITIHCGLSRIDEIDNPDRLVFDLDPSDGDFGKVQNAAALLKELLDALEVTSFVQVTGSRGIHVLVVLDRSANFDQAREFARAAAQHLATSHTELLTIEQRLDKRGNRVFIDCGRNAYGQTAIAPYSVRPRAGAPVATPLEWSEALSSGLDPAGYTIKNIFRRLSQKEDPWAGIGRHGQSIAKASQALQQLKDE